MDRKIKFVCKAVKWFDRINGNTYHSVRITRREDGSVIAGAFTYGYGDHYQQTALKEMLKNKWLPKKYNKDNLWNYQRENNYPILWDVSQGLKRNCVSNGIL